LIDIGKTSTTKQYVGRSALYLLCFMFALSKGFNPSYRQNLRYIA
jgi:hypothetical protein